MSDVEKSIVQELGIYIQETCKELGGNGAYYLMYSVPTGFRTLHNIAGNDIAPWLSCVVESVMKRGAN
jgi:hypothetical protein